MRVALDLDGVIVNFTKQGCKVMGEPYPSNFVFSHYSWLFDKYGKHSCYKRMKGHPFWTTMEKFPWSDRLIKMVDTVTEGNWIFLTKPMADPYCYSGKAEWIRTHYPRYEKKLVICAANKNNFARNQFDVLIDDKIENITDWNTAGGTGLFWQELSDDIDNQILESQLEVVETFLKSLSVTSKSKNN